MRPNGAPSTFTILIDDREKLPYEYDNFESKRLVYGDYSIANCPVAIERKTLDDFTSSISGKRRARFESNIKKAKEDLEYYAIVIEANYEDLDDPKNWYNQISPACVKGTALKWSLKYGVPIYFVGNREKGKEVVYQLLEGAKIYFLPTF